MSQKTEFGLALARMRKLRPNLSQRALSERARLGTSAIGQYESGARRNPERPTVEVIAAALGASRSELEELLRKAGRLHPGEMIAQPDRPPMEVYLRGDPDLTREQREILLKTYEQLVRLNRGS